ncbi:hypothetical protein GWI33_001984 [Rhynchophorus ferrugineus]|uniref:Large ribosomal subunit protein mL38 n=1 Tax=Rhynchophorus ferrugineus TaxID=354439 RepID=A0A834IS84_RHYFE|nr:hypothetical protein GWI33_001984 [Rhynchophorus ferrugineus]
MSRALFKLCNYTLCDNISPIFVRYGHHLRGKPPGIAKSLQEKLTELNYKDPQIHFKVDIGLPPPQISKTKFFEERMQTIRKNRKNPDMEKLSRTQQLQINMEETYADWLNTVGPYHIRQIAEHYGIFEHLFGDAYFHAFVPLKIAYENNDTLYPVYYGNTLKPDEAASKPVVEFENNDNSLYTLILTNPDGHLTDNEKEYIHWFVANIPGNTLDNGETIVEYLQPFPPKGTGYHRFVFVLYKQNKKLDFSQYKKQGKCLNLVDRTFSTLDFYRQLQDDITPASLSFFQADWTPSLKQFFHNELNMKEPIYEYDFPPPYIRKQEWFPKRRPFNLYMDKYRDPKQINKEFLLKKLKDIHPFKPPPKPLPYPNAQFIDSKVPSWLKTEIIKERMKWGRINEIE